MERLLRPFRRIYAYKRLFRNWIQILSELRRNKDLIRVVMIDGSSNVCTIECIVTLADLVDLYNFDPEKFYFNKDGLFYSNNLIIRDSRGSILITAGGFIKDDDTWYNKKYNLKFSINTNYLALFETFVLEQYNTEIEGEVVDIGANIGDSSLYFAVKCASHVYAFEPLPSVYKIALENIKLNHLENKISLFNAAIGSKEGKIKVPSYIDADQSGKFTVTNVGDVEVPVIPFDKVREMVKDPYLLKMDCEGCEADIIFSSELDFEKLFVESHPNITNIPHKQLIKQLEYQDYKCLERMRTGKYNRLYLCEKRR